MRKFLIKVIGAILLALLFLKIFGGLIKISTLIIVILTCFIVIWALLGKDSK